MLFHRNSRQITITKKKNKKKIIKITEPGHIKGMLYQMLKRLTEMKFKSIYI